MLEALDRVDWPRLTHALGSAADVPGLLRALVSPSADRRADALDELHGNIWHQGTVYEATAAAVPFLVELLVCPATRDRAEIAVLLGLCARGHSYHELHRPDRAEEVCVERHWVRAAHESVRAHLPALLSVLEDSDGDVRSAVVHALAALHEDRATVVPALASALEREAHARRRAVIGLALALLGRLQPAAFEGSGDDLPRDRLHRLAAAEVAGDIGDREEVMELLLDLATDSFDAERLDDLGF